MVCMDGPRPKHPCDPVPPAAAGPTTDSTRPTSFDAI